MLTKSINFKNFKVNKVNKVNQKIDKDFKILIKEKSTLLKSLGTTYKNIYTKKVILRIKKYSNIRIIGMGGSILGTESIYDFLRHKVKKKFIFINNLQSKIKNLDKKKYANLIVSKSGNTLETICNVNIFVKKKEKNVFITENKKSYLFTLAKKLKAEIIHHNNFIGGRYSVLSEVGMLPAELMGLNIKKFKQINNLVKNKNFVNSLIANVNSTLYFLKKKNLIP